MIGPSAGLLTALWLAAGTAFGAPPEPPPVGLVAEPEDVVEQYRSQALAAGRSAPASELVCGQAFDTVRYCLTVRPADAKRWRYGTKADMGPWSEERAALAAGERAVKAIPLEKRLQKRLVEGTEHHYWATDADDGLDAAPLLQPRKLSALIGGPPVVAVPAQGVVIAWSPGHPERDEILAVGVRRMYEAAAHPVSSRVYRWDGARWVVWGEAMDTSP